jgi:hypothetical protein
MTTFKPCALPVLIGSMPQCDHADAAELIASTTPEIPVWAQLPVHPQEGMVPQFLAGMPGWQGDPASLVVDLSAEGAAEEMVTFYEEVLAFDEQQLDLDHSRFTLLPFHAGGFHELCRRWETASPRPVAVKGQVTGPITFTMAVKDPDQRSIFYDHQLRDAAIQLLALKARWQIRHLKRLSDTVIVFMDEPALAGFGSSEMISISRDDIVAALNTVGGAIQAEGGLAGIHVCANTDWSMIIDSGVDVINFDAYGYFDRFVLFPDQIAGFIDAGGIVAWGLVPTSDPDVILRETPETLFARWQDAMNAMAREGIDTARLASQSLISPSCGAGSLTPELAERVLDLTRRLSDQIRTANAFT